MCYGTHCGNERFDTGICADPCHCAMKDHERDEEERACRIARLRTSPYLCPDCDERGKAVYLKRDSQSYLCPECGTEYDPTALLDAYQGMYEGLIADAEWTAARMEDIRAAHPALMDAAPEPESPAPAAPALTRRGRAA